jgi:predicted kinase
MKKFYILCGYPFAGKSTIAKTLEEKFGFVRIEMKKYFKDNDNVDSDKTYETYIAQIKHALQQKKSVIIDTVGYNKKGRDDLKKLAEEYHTKPFIIYVNTPLSIVKERWLKNKQTNERHDVSESEFENIENNFEVPTQEENVIIVTPDMKREEILNSLKI